MEEGNPKMGIMGPVFRTARIRAIREAQRKRRAVKTRLSIEPAPEPELELVVEPEPVIEPEPELKIIRPSRKRKPKVIPDEPEETSDAGGD